MNQVLKDMQNKVTGVMPDMKMVLYSAVCFLFQNETSLLSLFIIA